MLFFIMNKKAAIGLSVNMLVIIIISLVILGAGISLLYKFIGGAQDIKGQLDMKTQAELEHLLVDQGKRVALPLHVANVVAGESHVFGIGILNVDTQAHDFFINVSLSRVSDESKEDITDNVNIDGWLLYNEELIRIQQNEHHSESILVSVPEDAPRGEYIFKARVYNNEDTTKTYDNPQTFYVNVK